jgi:hypothetical protein
MTVSPILKRLDASVDDFYMELEICDDIVYERHENKRSGDIIYNYRDIFYKTTTLTKKEDRVENIYVLGDAGAGKSTWCLKLINMWLKGFDEKKKFTSNEKIMLEFDVVFFVALRHASKEIDLIEMIRNQIFDQTPVFYDHSMTVLSEEPEKCLVIVDGLDEWNPPGVKISSPFGKTSKLPGRRNLNHCTVLTTSRPWKLNEVKPAYNNVDRAVIIRGFERSSSISVLSGKVIDKLVEKDINPHKSCDENKGGKQVNDFESEVKKLFNMTNSSNDYPDLMKIPLILIFMVLRWFKDGALEKTMTGNYSSLIENILDHEEGYKRSGQNLDYDGRLSRITDIDQAKKEWSSKVDMLPECLKERAMIKQYSGILLTLSKIAFDGLFDGLGNQLIFNEEEILEQLTPLELEVSVKSGILSKTSLVGGSSYEKSKLSFLHKTVQEYLAAVFMIVDMKDGTSLDIFKHICRYDKIQEMENVIMFVCGLDADLGSALINHISYEERGVMQVSEKFYQSPTHFYFKCYKELQMESGIKLPLNYFVLEHWHHAKDFLELLKASDDKISYGKIGLFYEAEIRQPKLLEYFPPINLATSNLTSLVLETITLDCSDSVKVFELLKLKNLHISCLDCKCQVTDVDKEIRCCLNLDFSNCINIEKVEVSNVSLCKLSLSGRRLVKLGLEYLMLCHIEVCTGILETSKENHETNEDVGDGCNKSTNIDCVHHTIDLMLIQHCEKSEIVHVNQSSDLACPSLIVRLYREGNKQCEIKNFRIIAEMVLRRQQTHYAVLP